MIDIVDDLRHPKLRNRPFTLCGKAADEIDRLRADLKGMAEYALKLDASNDDYQAEIEALRKELATKDARIAEQTSAAIGMAAANEMLRKDLAEAKAALENVRALNRHHLTMDHQLRSKIAAINEENNDLIDAVSRMTLERDHEMDTLRKELVALRETCERSAELIARRAKSEDCLRMSLEAANARIAFMSGHGIVQDNETLRKELAEANAIIHGMQDGSLARDQMGIIERAEARIAELENANTEITTEALREHRVLRDRAERAEAELEKCKKGNDSLMESYCRRHNDSIEQRERAERAEAECKALRSLLAKAENALAGAECCIDADDLPTNFNYIQDVRKLIHAALNSPQDQLAQGAAADETLANPGSKDDP